MCVVSNSIAAFLAPIQDCDEVFNFWEPTHYLNHGYGLQTWEYSPVYSIRSWLYISIHGIAGKIGSFLVGKKSSEFYLVRFFLAMICAACQTRLYSAICRTLSPRIGLLFLMIAAFSPGMFHASASFLPSSFTMYASMLGLAAFLDWRRSQKTAQGIMWFGLGAIVGWPFAGALLLPLLFEEVVIGFISGDMRKVFSEVLNGALRCLAILVFLGFVASFRFSTNSFRSPKSLLTIPSFANLPWCRGTLSHITYSGVKVEGLISLARSLGRSTSGTCS